MPGDSALSEAGEQDLSAAFDRAREIKDSHGLELMAKANVVGVGVGLRTREGAQTREVALIVMVTQKLPRSMLEPEDILPRAIEGVPIDVQAVGELRPQA